MDLEAKHLLRRYCFLGTLKPIRKHVKLAIDLTKVYNGLKGLCLIITGDDMQNMLRDVLLNSYPPRFDEALLLYAIYLTSEDIDKKDVLMLRNAFTTLINDDAKLFLFAKYARLVLLQLDRKPFNRTIKKAIASWYQTKNSEELQEMWMARRGGSGFTHKVLFKMSRVTSKVVDRVSATIFLKTCTQLQKGEMVSDKSQANSKASSDDKKTKNHNNNAKIIENGVQNKKRNNNNKKGANKNRATNIAKSSGTSAATIPEKIMLMSKLRTTPNPVEAVKIIKRLNVKFSQVPPRLLRQAAVLEVLIPTMTYNQLLKNWRIFVGNKFLENARIRTMCKKVLTDKKTANEHDMHPLQYLLQMCTLSGRHLIKLENERPTPEVDTTLLKELYAHSFTRNKASKYRMHITINLQSLYKKKVLYNYQRVQYVQAAISLAFGYFKMEKKVDVHYWNQNPSELKRIEWKKEMTIEKALDVAASIKCDKVKQDLTLPIKCALASDTIYDVFMVIVPSATRGNPKNCSDFLAENLSLYHAKKNPKAKFIIVDLLRYEPSMEYSLKNKQNILEICGVDQHTTELIHEFIRNKFD